MNKSSTLLPFLFYFSPLSILSLFWYFISKRFRFFSVSGYRPRAHEPTTAYHLSYFLVLVPSVDFFLSYYFDFSSLTQVTIDFVMTTESFIDQSDDCYRTFDDELFFKFHFVSFVSFFLFRIGLNWLTNRKFRYWWSRWKLVTIIHSAPSIIGWFLASLAVSFILFLSNLFFFESIFI